MVADVWGGMSVVYREAAYTPIDIRMPRTGVGIAFKGDTGSRSRLGNGTTKVRQLDPGSVFVFADDDFTWAENDSAYAGVALGFDEHSLAELADQIGAPMPELRSAHFESDDDLLLITKLMARELLSSGPGADLYRDSLATVAKIHLLRRYSGIKPNYVRTGGALASAEVRLLRDYMLAHLHENLSLEQLGRMVNLSPYHFARLFKASTGKPPHRYLTELRIGRAREMLVGTRLPISTIAWRVGFSSVSQFGLQFRRLTGAPPSSFRSSPAEQEIG
jgi:AraC family transcriptional regulator